MASKQQIKVGTVAITTGSKHWGHLNDGLTVVVIGVEPASTLPYRIRRVDGQRIPVAGSRFYALDTAITDASRLIPVDPDGTDDLAVSVKCEVAA